MRVKVSGNTAISERCVCRRCNHYFMTEDALTKAESILGAKSASDLMVCCPVCFSEDIVAQNDGRSV